MKNPLYPTDPLAQAHSEKLQQHLAELIHTQGPLDFAHFMELALYAPGLGYYVAGAHKLGKGGDFVTAPELTPIFAQCLAHQCAEVINNLKTADILELGAGSGKMALGILRELAPLNALPEHYYILELSPDLQERQQVLFETEAPEFLSRIKWLNHLPTINGIILANEVLDAMPVHRFKQNNELLEYYVSIENNQLRWTLKPASTELKTACKETQIEFAEGYESEINLVLKPFIKSLADHLEQGLMLFIDYGFPRAEYYHPQRDQGTLMCHYQHQAHSDPLILVGIQDITAHVDFTAAAEAGLEAGLELAGFVNQATFLINCGLNELIQSDDLNQLLAVKQLVLPTEMGELFKAIGFTRGLEFQPMGFRAQDQWYRL